MASGGKRNLVEGLVFAGAMGLVALVLVLLGMLADSRRSAFERDALYALAKRPLSGKAAERGSPELPRIYRLPSRGKTSFGLVLPLRDSKEASLAAAILAADGELEAIRLLGSSPASREEGGPAWLQSLVGSGGSTPYPSSKEEAKNADAVSGSTESFLAAAASLERASAAVRLVAKERP